MEPQWSRSWHPEAWEAHLKLSERSRSAWSSSRHNWRCYVVGEDLYFLNSFTNARKVLPDPGCEMFNRAVVSYDPEAFDNLLAFADESIIIPGDD